MAKKNGKKTVSTIGGLARLMQDEFLRVHERFEGVEGDVRELKADTHEVKGDIREVKTDMIVVKSDIRGMKTDIQTMKDRSGELFAKLDAFIALYKETKQELTISRGTCGAS